MAFASTGCAYLLWLFLGMFGAHRFYLGRPKSGLVWLFTGGLFGVGWLIDLFLIPEFVEEHNKRVFHQQMLETGNRLLFDGDYGVQSGMFYPAGEPAGGRAAYGQAIFYPQQGRGGGYDGYY